MSRITLLDISNYKPEESTGVLLYRSACEDLTLQVRVRWIRVGTVEKRTCHAQVSTWTDTGWVQMSEFFFPNLADMDEDHHRAVMVMAATRATKTIFDQEPWTEPSVPDYQLI